MRWGRNRTKIVSAIVSCSAGIMVNGSAYATAIPANAIYADSFSSTSLGSSLGTDDHVEIAPTTTSWLFGGGSSNYGAIAAGTNTPRNSGASNGVLRRTQNTTAASGNSVDVAAYTLTPTGLSHYVIAADVLVPTNLPTAKLDGWNDTFWGVDIMEYAPASTNYYSSSYHNIRIGLSHQNTANGSYVLVSQQLGYTPVSIVLSENDKYGFSSTDWNQILVQVDLANNLYTIFLNGVQAATFSPGYTITPYYAGVETVTNLKTDGTFSTSLDNFYIAPVPEPASLAWMITSGLLLFRKKSL